jgi:hypothetical protein
MSTPERLIEHAATLIRQLSVDARERKHLRRKRRRRILRKLVKTFGLMMLAALLILVAMVSTGLLFGPRAVEGLIAAPLAILASWSAIVYWSLSHNPAPLRLPKDKTLLLSADNLADRIARTEAWLDGERGHLPFSTRPTLDSIALRLSELVPQVRALPQGSQTAHEVQRLVCEELPDLVSGYRKLPRALQQKPLHGGASPDQSLQEGLSTIDEAIGLLHARLAADDLHALATQQRYLASKYQKKGGLDE